MKSAYVITQGSPFSSVGGWSSQLLVPSGGSVCGLGVLSSEQVVLPSLLSSA